MRRPAFEQQTNAWRAPADVNQVSTFNVGGVTCMRLPYVAQAVEQVFIRTLASGKQTRQTALINIKATELALLMHACLHQCHITIST